MVIFHGYVSLPEGKCILGFTEDHGFYISSFPLEDPPKPGCCRAWEDNWDRTGFHEPIYGISWGYLMGYRTPTKILDLWGCILLSNCFRFLKM